MGQLGMGVMINALFGRSDRMTAEEFESLKQGVISSVTLTDNMIKVKLEDGRILVLTDDGQSCCESRYITTDDDLSYFAGASLIDVDLGEHRTTSGDYGDEHEIQFLNVKTSKGVITFETHNEHNGYYGGFSISAKLLVI